MSEQERIGGLEQQIEELKSQLADVRQRLINAEFDQWRGRIDDLEVQARLGSDVGPGPGDAGRRAAARPVAGRPRTRR